MSSEPTETDAPAAPPELNALDTSIDELRNRFPFIDTFKQSERSRHFIVQDLEHDINASSPYFFLRQCFFSNEAEFRFAFDYFKKYQHYCRGPFAKGDIIRLYQIYFAEDPQRSYFELALIMDIGEPDRIDIELIQPEQITKFLRTVCVLLDDVKRQENIAHGHLNLKNVVLVNGKIKISGFKPVYLGSETPTGWKRELCSKFGCFRADLYMVGLLWLRFLGAPVDGLTDQATTFEEVHSHVWKLLEEKPEYKQVNIINNLVDVEGRPELSLEEVIRQFEEWLVLDHYNSRPDPNSGALNVFDLESISQSDHKSKSSGAKRYSRNNSGESNPFHHAMAQSEEEQITLKDEDIPPRSKNTPEYLKIDCEFTLQDNDSLNLHPPLKSAEIPPVPIGRPIHGERKVNDVLEQGFVEGPQGPQSNSILSARIVAVPVEQPKEDVVNSMRDIKNEVESFGIGQVMLRKDGRPPGRPSNAERSTPTGDYAAPMKEEENAKIAKVNRFEIAKKLPEHDSKMSLEDLEPELADPGFITVDKGEDSPVSNRDAHSSFQVSGERPSKQEWVTGEFQPTRVELSQKQLEDIEQETVTKIMDQREALQRGAIDGLVQMQEKHEAAARESERLMEKIAELGSKKLAQKKAKEGPKKNQKTMPENPHKGSSNVPAKPEKADTGQSRKGNEAKTETKAEAKVEAKVEAKAEAKAETKAETKAPATTPKTQAALPITQKPKDNKPGAVALADSRKQFGMSSVQQRDALFSYTHDMKNKNISFKKMLQRVEPLPAAQKTAEMKTTTRLVTSELPKQPGASLEGLVAENDSLKKTRPPNAPNLRSIRDVSAQLGLPPLLQALAAVAANPSKHRVPPWDSQDRMPSPEALERYGGLSASFGNPDRISEPEARVTAALEQNSLSDAIKAMKKHEKDLESNPQAYLGVLAQLDHHFMTRGPFPARKAVLYEALGVLSRYLDLDSGHRLQQELSLDLARIEAEDGNLGTSVRILQTDAFDAGVIDSESYYTQLGEAYAGLQDDRSAAQSFQRLLNELVSDSLVHFDITRVFAVTFRVFHLLHRTNNQVRLAFFFMHMLGALQDIRRVNQVLHLHENDYQNLVEIFVLNTLRFAAERQDPNLTNFVLHNVVSKNLLDFENNMSPGERDDLVRFIADFCGHLATLADFGGFRDNYVAFLEFARRVLKTAELNPSSLKREISVHFALAMLHLRTDNFGAAQETLDKCFSSYFAFFQTPDPTMFEVLFDLGENLVRKGRFAESVFYFQRVLDLECPDATLRVQALKELAKTEFRCAAFAKSANHAETFLRQHFGKAEASGYWKYSTLFFLAAGKADPKRVEGMLAELAKEQTRPGCQIFGVYLRAFKAFQGIFAGHHEFKENAKHLAPIEEIAKGAGTNTSDFPKILQNFAELFFKYVESKPAGTDPVPAFMAAVVDPLLTVTENAHLLLQLLLDLTLTFVTLVPTFKERLFNHETRQRLFEAFRRQFPRQGFVHFLNEAVKRHNYAAIESREVLNASRVSALARTPGILPKTQAANSPPKTQVADSPPKTQPKSAKDPSGPSGPTELQKLATEFAKCIQEILFRDSFQDVLAYCSRFQSVMAERGHDSKSFEFVGELVALHLKNTKNGVFDQVATNFAISQNFASDSLNVQDLKLAVLVLESFKNPEYLRSFVNFLDSSQHHYALIVFNDIFANTFNRKFDSFVSEAYRWVQESPLAAIEDHFFAQHLRLSDLGARSFVTEFGQFDRLRYSVMAEETLLPVFNRHVNFDEMVKFNLRYRFLVAFREALKGPVESASESLRKFKNDLVGLLIRLRVEESHVVELLYHLLLLARLTRFVSPAEMCDCFLKVALFMLDRLNFGMNYQFSRVLSELGKVFFRQGQSRPALKAFMVASSLLDDANSVHPFEPSFVVSVTHISHVFDTHAFLVAVLVAQRSVSPAAPYLKRLENLEINSETTRLDIDALTVMLSIGSNKTAQALKTLFGVAARMPEMNLTAPQRKLYMAVFDTLSAWAVRRAEHNEKDAISEAEEKARNSVLSLYQ